MFRKAREWFLSTDKELWLGFGIALLPLYLAKFVGLAGPPVVFNMILIIGVSFILIGLIGLRVEGVSLKEIWSGAFGRKGKIWITPDFWITREEQLFLESQGIDGQFDDSWMEYEEGIQKAKRLIEMLRRYKAENKKRGFIETGILLLIFAIIGILMALENRDVPLLPILILLIVSLYYFSRAYN